MARVTYGESITEYAGSIGGVTFLRNASGPIAKLRSNPPVNPSPDQSTYQTNMAALVAYWPTLSQANKDAWDTFAGLHDHTTPWGQTKTLSGFQWFLSVNGYRVHHGYAIISSPPVWEVFAAPSQFVIQTSATYIRLYWDPAWDPVSWWLLFVSLPLRQSSIKLRRSNFFLQFVKSGDPVTIHDFTTLYEAFANITWASFYASSDCSIIARVQALKIEKGLTSSFTSAIVKIG